MGKKPKSNKGKEKAMGRKLDKSTLPDPPGPVENEVRYDAVRCGAMKVLLEFGYDTRTRSLRAVFVAYPYSTFFLAGTRTHIQTYTLTLATHFII